MGQVQVQTPSGTPNSEKAAGSWVGSLPQLAVHQTKVRGGNRRGGGGINSLSKGGRSEHMEPLGQAQIAEGV